MNDNTEKIIKPRIGYKVLCKGMKSMYGDFSWKKGRWYKHEKRLSMCGSGFHASTNFVDALGYNNNNLLCEIEYKGDVIYSDTKFVASEMRVVKTYRLTKKKAVKWSIQCAKSCLEDWNKYDEDDKRPLLAIKAAEACLDNPSVKNKKAAESAGSAWSAAWSARSAAWSARSAAWSARSAAWSARSAAWSARSAAWSAAESAAWSAAESAAESAAWSAESARKEVLHKKLMKILKE